MAIKILNPVGYKLFPSALLSRCLVAVRGAPVAPPALDSDELARPTATLATSRAPGAFAGASAKVRLRPEYVLRMLSFRPRQLGVTPAAIYT